MRVYGVHHGLDSGFSLHSRDSFRNQFVTMRANDMNPQDLTILLICDYLYKALVVAFNRGFAVSKERELADFHLMSLRLGLRLRQSHTADSRFAIRDIRNPVFVDRLRQLLDVTEEQYYLMAPTPRVSVAAKKVRAAYNAVQALTQPG